MNPAQHAAWLEHTGYSEEQFPLSLAIQTLSDRKTGNYLDRRSLETFLAGWNAAELAKLEKPINEQLLSGIFKRSL